MQCRRYGRPRFARLVREDHISKCGDRTQTNPKGTSRHNTRVTSACRWRVAISETVLWEGLFVPRVCVRVQVVDDRSVGRDRKPCVDHPRCTRFTLSHQQRPPRAFRLLSVRGVISSGRPAFRFQTVRVLFRVPRRRFVRRHLTRILLNKKNTCDSLYYRLSVWRKKKKITRIQNCVWKCAFSKSRTGRRARVLFQNKKKKRFSDLLSCTAIVKTRPRVPSI